MSPMSATDGRAYGALPERPSLVFVMTVPLSVKLIEGQGAYLRERGFHVHVITSRGKLLEEYARREDVSVWPVEMLRRITPIRDVGAVWQIWRILRQVRPLIVHAHTPKGGLLGMVAAWLARVPVRVYHVQGLPFMTAQGGRRALLRWTERVSCFLSNRVFSISLSIREVLVAEGLCPANKVRILGHGSPNGVDLDRFCPARFGASAREAVRNQFGVPMAASLLGFLGRVVRDKGIIELAGAWGTLREEFPELHLVVAGPVEPQDPIPPDVQRLLQEDSRVHMIEWVENTAGFYAAIDILVLPTYREGFGSVLIEAGAMEVPVIATRVPGCVDAVEDGLTGTLVPASDVGALVDAVRRYLSDQRLRRDHGLAGRERVVKHFRRETLWDALYDEYQSLLSERGFNLGGDGGGERARER